MHPLGEISLWILAAIIAYNVFKLIEFRIEENAKALAAVSLEKWLKENEGNITNEYAKRNAGALCAQVVEHIKKSRKEHGVQNERLAITWTIQIAATINTGHVHTYRDTLAQFSLDLQVVDVDIANLVESFRVMEHEDVRTMWRAKFGEEQVSVDDVMEDAVGAALFEVLTQDLDVERQYDTYRQTLYFKLKNAGS